MSSAPNSRKSSRSISWATDTSFEKVIRKIPRNSGSYKEGKWKGALRTFEEPLHSLPISRSQMTPIAESHVPVQEYIAFPANADLLTAPAKSKNLIYGILNLPARILAPDGYIPNSIYMTRLQKEMASEITLESPMSLAERELDALAERFLSESASEVAFAKNVVRVIEEMKRRREERKKTKKTARMEPIRMTTIETDRPHLMELDALCEYEEDLKDTAEDLRKRNVSKALIRQRTKKEMMERIEEKIMARKKEQERLIAYVRNRRTTSYGLISDGRSDDVSMGTLTHEETKVVLARMRSLFKDDQQVALQISQALDGNLAVCTKMKVYVGQGIDYQRFLASVLTPDWLFLYLSMHFGSEQEVMALLEVYRTADPESAEAKDAIARLKKATKDIEIVKNFLDLFTPLVQTLAEALSLVFPSLEEAKNFVKRALGGDTMAIQKILNVTGVDAEDLEAVLDTVKRCRDYQCAVLCAGLQKHIAERLESTRRETEMRRQTERLMREEERNFKADSSDLSSGTSEPTDLIMLEPGSTDYEAVVSDALRSETPPPPLLPQPPPATQESEITEPPSSSRPKIKPERQTDAGAAPVFTKHPPKKRRKIGGGLALATRASQVLLSEGSFDDELLDQPDDEAEEEEEENEEEEQKVEDELSIALISESSSEEQPSQNFETDEALLDPEARKSKLLKRMSSTPKLHIMYRVASENYSISDVLDSVGTQDSVTFVEEKVLLLQAIVLQDWFPEHDIVIEPNRIAAVMAGTLMNMPFDDMPVVISMCNNLMRNFPLMDDCLAFVLYCLRKAYHRCVDHLRRHVHIEDPQKSNLVDIGRRIINILADNGMEATPYILKLVFAAEHRSDRSSLLEEEDEDLLHPPEIPLVPDIDLKRHLETLKERGPAQKPSTLSDISEVSEDSFEDGVVWDVGRPLSHRSQKPKRSLPVPTEANLLQVRGQRASEIVIKPVGVVRHQRRGQQKDPSKVVKPNKPLAIFSEEAKKKMPVLKSFLNSKPTDKPESSLTTAQDLINFLNTSEMTPQKRELVNACQEILEMDVATMGEIRSLMLNQMDSIPSKVGMKGAVGKTFNFLNLFKTAMTPTRRKTLAAEPKLRSIYVNALLDELKRAMNDIKKLSVAERVLWLSLPENYEQTAEAYRQIAKILDENVLQDSQREPIVQFVLQDLLDCMALIDPAAGLSDQERQVLFDRCMAAVDVLEWFGIETREFAQKLAGYPELLQESRVLFPDTSARPTVPHGTKTAIKLPHAYHQFLPESIINVVSPTADVTSTQVPLMQLLQTNKLPILKMMSPEKLTAKKIEVLQKYRAHVLTGEKALKAKIKGALQETVWNELSPTLLKGQELELELDRMKELLDKSNPVDRVLWLTLPEVTQAHRELYKAVGELIHAGAMTPDLRTKVVSAGLQNICDLILVVYNKNDFKKEDRQYAYNQASAISEMLRWFNLDPPPFTYELHKHTDLEDRYTPMFAAGNAPKYTGASDIILSEEYASLLPRTFLRKINKELILRHSDRLSLPKFLVQTNAKVFNEMSPFEFAQRRLNASMNMSIKLADLDSAIQIPLDALSPESLVTKVARKIVGVRTILTAEEEGQASPTSSPPESPQQLERASSSSAFVEPEVKAGLETLETATFAPSFTSEIPNNTPRSGEHTPSKRSTKGLKALLEMRQVLQVEGRKPKTDSFWSDSISFEHIRPSAEEREPTMTSPSQPRSQRRPNSPTSSTEEKKKVEDVTPLQRPERSAPLPPLTIGGVLPTTYRTATSSLETTGEAETSKTLALKSAQPSALSLSSPETDSSDTGYAHGVQKRMLTWSIVSKIPHQEGAESVESESARRQQKSLHYKAMLSHMPAEMLVSESQQEQEEALAAEVVSTVLTFAPSEMRRSIGSSPSIKSHGSLSEVSLLRAARLLLDIEPKKSHKAGREKKAQIRKQMRLNMILQHLRKNLAPTEIAELFADLNTGIPSKRTQLLLEESGKVVDEMMADVEFSSQVTGGRRLVRPSYISSLDWCRLGIKGTGLQDSSKNYPSNPDITAHCPSDMLARMGTSSFGLKPVDIMQRADVIGYISKAIQDRAYRRIKNTMETCLKHLEG